jgi:hypothetical protein
MSQGNFMSNEQFYFGEVEEEDFVVGDDNVEKRYSLKGRNVRFHMNLVFICQQHIKLKGYKSVHERDLFSEVYDAVFPMVFEDSKVLRIRLGSDNPGKVVVLDMARYDSVLDFCQKTEQLAFEVKKAEGKLSQPKPQPQPQDNLDEFPALDLEDETEAQTNAQTQDKPQVELSEEDELAALEREYNETGS